MVEAYPLHWPSAYPRAKYTIKSKFAAVNLDACRNDMLAELRRLNAKNVVVSTNFPLRKDGLFQATAPRGGISDHGVAVYFELDKESMVLCCDRWHNIESNIVAITKTIDAMRGMDRWGVSEMLKRAFSGFKALPESKEWWEILKVAKTASPEEIKRAYYALAKIHHPDNGGNNSEFLLISEAYQTGMSKRQTA